MSERATMHKEMDKLQDENSKQNEELWVLLCMTFAKIAGVEGKKSVRNDIS